MKSYISKQVECRTIDNNRKSMQKVSVASNSIIQFAPHEIKTEAEIKELSLAQLSFFVSESIRKDLYKDFSPIYWNETYVNYDDTALMRKLKNQLKIKQQKENTLVLYEYMIGETDGKIVYPGLDSCLGITVIKNTAEKRMKKGAHLVIPTEDTATDKYQSLIGELYDFANPFGEDIEIKISCKDIEMIDIHRSAILGKIQNEFYEKFNKLIKKGKTITETDLTLAATLYKTETIHTVE